MGFGEDLVGDDLWLNRFTWGRNREMPGRVIEYNMLANSLFHLSLIDSSVVSFKENGLYSWWSVFPASSKSLQTWDTPISTIHDGKQNQSTHGICVEFEWRRVSWSTGLVKQLYSRWSSSSVHYVQWNAPRMEGWSLSSLATKLRDQAIESRFLLRW